MSLIKRFLATLYRKKVLRALDREWDSQYWSSFDGRIRVVRCQSCPKFDPRRGTCRIPFGTPLRKCVTAALEANLRHFRNMVMLEIGCGESSYARSFVEALGNTWIGMDPRDGKKGKKSVRTLCGYASDIPLKSDYFDVVFGIQALEHFEDRDVSAGVPSTYEACFKEIARVLKPGGFIYFDAPIHLHGHEMFIVGDLDRICSLLDPSLWTDIVFEKWRFDYSPLPRYSPPQKEVVLWPDKVKGYPPSRLEQIRNNASVWLLTLKARKLSQPS